jgi:hypothetical protein
VGAPALHGKFALGNVPSNALIAALRLVLMTTVLENFAAVPELAAI